MYINYIFAQNVDTYRLLLITTLIKKRFEEHVNNCEGKISSSICLNEQSVPFIPHIQKNPVYPYLLAHNRSNEYQVIQEYITNDFETVLKKETHKISNKTSSYTQQLPLSLAYYINNSKTTKFMYRGEKTNEEFINNWLNSLFGNAEKSSIIKTVIIIVCVFLNIFLTK
jgi:hypothetical protein